jgi:hypothetical protein
MTRIALVAVMIFLCFPVFASAKEHNYDDAKVTTSSSNPYSKVAITPQASMYATVQISGNQPGTFTLQNWVGSAVDSANVPNVAEAELYYPINIGTDIDYENGLGLTNELNTYYVNVANNSNKFGEYKVALLTDRHKIGNGDSIEVQITTGLVPEVDINIERHGIYQIWYSEAITPTILSPSGKMVNVVQTQLPNSKLIGGSTLGRYLYFAAFEIGKYKMTFTTGASSVNLRCEYFKSKTIRGNAVSDGVEPGSSEILNPEYHKFVYDMNINLEDYYVYSLDFDFNDPGAANRRIFYETASSSTSATLGVGTNLILSPGGGSKVFIVIDTPNYFTWASAGVAESNVPKFTMKFEEQSSKKADLGETEMLVVSPQDYVIGKYVNVRKPGVLSLQFESIGPASPNLIHGTPYIQEIVDNQVVTPQIYEEVYNGGGNYSINVLLSKGKYKFGFSYSGSGGNEYLRLTTAFTKADDISVAVKNPAVDLTSGQFQDVTLQAWNSLPATYGATYGNALLWESDESFRHFGYNITFNPAKNGQIFNKDLTPNLEYLFDQDTPIFVDYTGASSLPIKTTGSTVGDAFIIGGYDKFRAIDVSLGTASDTDAFIWQYRSSGGWLSFNPATHDFVDGTHTASGSLQQSGTISWDPDTLTNWNFVQTASNNTGTGVPDTSNRPLYLIRILCNTSAATIPTVNNFSLKKFIKIQFDLNTEFGADTGPLGDSYYDDVTGNAEWATPQTVDNAQDSISLDDSTFGLNYNFNYKDYFLFLSSEAMVVYNYNGSNGGVTEKLTSNMVFSVSIYRINDWIQQEYKLGKSAPSVHSAEVNFSAFTGYGHTLTYNASSTAYAYLKILPARNHQFDWTQFIMNVTNGNVVDVFYYFPSSVTGYNIRADTDYRRTFTGSAEQYSEEIGFITEYILMEFIINPINPAEMVRIDFYGGHFNYPMITFKVSGFAWTWYYTVGAVGLGVIGGGVAAFFLLRKKKRGY